MMLLIAPTWHTQVWFPELLRMSIGKYLLLPQHRRLLTNAQGEIHPLVKNKTLRLAVWKISGKVWLRKAFQKQLPNLSKVQERIARSPITIRPGESGLAGVLGEKLIHFDVM